MSIVSLRGIALFVVVLFDFSCGSATIPETLCGPDFREYFSFLFSILGPVLSTCREGTPVTCFFIGFSCLAKRLLALFPCSLGPGVPGLGLVFFSRVSPIPFLGLVWLFWVWCHPSHFWARFGFFGCGPLAFLALFPPVFIVCQDFPVSFSCGFGPCVFVHTFSYCFNLRLSFLWRVGPCGQPSGPCFGPFLPFWVCFLFSLFLFPIWCSLARTLLSFMCPRPSSRTRSRGCCRFWRKSLTVTNYPLFSSFRGALSGSPLRRWLKRSASLVRAQSCSKMLNVT